MLHRLSLKLDRKEQELKSLSEEMEGMRVKLAAAAELSTAVASEHDSGGALGTKGPTSAHSSNSAKFFGDPSPDASEWFRDWNGDVRAASLRLVKRCLPFLTPRLCVSLPD